MRVLSFSLLFCSIATGWAATLVDTGPPDGQVAMKSGSRAGVIGSQFAAADDFVLSADTLITGGSFGGMLGAPFAADFEITSIQVSIYDLFPFDPLGSPYPVPGNLLETRSSVGGQLDYTENFDGTITVPSAIGLTGGPGNPLTGPMVTFSFQLLDPILLPAGQYFFSPEVATTCPSADPLCSGLPPSPFDLAGQFFWLSAPFPENGSDAPAALIGNFDFGPPDWISTASVVGLHNLSFSLTGEVVPEPDTAWLIALALAILVCFTRCPSKRTPATLARPRRFTDASSL
jgi:hypothetical protein